MERASILRPEGRRQLTPPPRLRCAIYTRKSSEEGLDQSFNSLHAQREACEAYVRSQLGQGWKLIPTAYDDGGYSGGSLERPGLRALMADIEAGRIDIVLVYKVDRLTRSLADFAKLVEAFDRKPVSFVSITQSFNTTTSMGRLTLNMLLSFAQFEREVTGERIRDKLAASKAKGMWMGGVPPLGYNPNGRSLAVNEPEAETVRMLFRRYLELRSVHALKAELDAAGIRSKAWISREGLEKGGVSFARGALFHLLRNRIYVGEITHKEKVYPGLHSPIIERELFDDVHAALADNIRARQSRPLRSATALLKGAIFDEDGEPMTPAFAYGKGGRVFRYYVSSSLQRGTRRSEQPDAVQRVAAPQLEALVMDRLQRILPIDRGELEADVGAYLNRATVRSYSVELSVNPKPLLKAHASVKSAMAVIAHTLPAGDQIDVGIDKSFRILIDVRPVFRGGRTWLIGPKGQSGIPVGRVDKAMIDALRRAHRTLESHGASIVGRFEIKQEISSPKDSYPRRLMRLAFLAPDIQQTIFNGRQPPGLSLQQLLSREIPVAWADQRATFGFP